MRLTFCVACGERDPDLLEHHHLLPRAEGGQDVETNLITLCLQCHGIVHDRVRRPSRDLQRLRMTTFKANRYLHFGAQDVLVSKRERRRKITRRADQMVERAKRLGVLFDDIRARGAISLRQVANEMNARGLRNRKGGEWDHASVRALMIRVAKHDPNHPYEPQKQGGPKKLSSPLARVGARD